MKCHVVTYWSSAYTVNVSVNDVVLVFESQVHQCVKL